ncbi:MAG: prepilin-type N-terminal cleavage/methylation domain-containing protein [Deltaproteobacteria bacterium]|nr:prepilin-type N-terminal cleavage/methylation domain-containing protein [Deltaproteobacteria bacterium]
MNNSGYTLIELIVVTVLIGIVLYLGLPALRDTLLDDSLKSASRQLVGAVRELRSEAVREQVDYVLLFDFSRNSYWTYTADMTPEKRDERRHYAKSLPEGVRVQDIHLVGRERQEEDEGTITFFKQGYVQPALIHLAWGERRLTLVLEPFLSTVKVLEGYVDYEQSLEEM